MDYQTEMIKIESNRTLAELMESAAVKKGAELLRRGEVVAFPTETVYGLGADASNPDAVTRIFKAKGRPQDNPLIVHISRLEELDQIISGGLNSAGERLAAAFWPGPLTMVLSRSNQIPEVTTAGLNSVGVRMPSHQVARALIEVSGCPLAAPSANISGAPSPTLAEHVYHDLKGKIPLIIDGGAAPVGVESTVVDVRGETPILLRPGGVSREELEFVLDSRVEIAGKVARDDTPRAPGMKYRHYSPHTPLFLITGDKLQDQLLEYQDREIGLVITDERADLIEELPANITVYTMGSLDRPEEIASRIFALLRELDQENFDLILVETIPEKGIGAAVMNRLYKASIKE